MDSSVLELGCGEADVTPVFELRRQIAWPTTNKDVVSSLHAAVQLGVHLVVHTRKSIIGTSSFRMSHVSLCVIYFVTFWTYINIDAEETHWWSLDINFWVISIKVHIKQLFLINEI